VVAAAIVGAGVASAGASVIGSSMASKAQSKAAAQANATEREQYAQTRSDLMPFQTAGQTALSSLGTKMNALTSPITMDQGDLQKTPGYQFTMNQGLKSTQNGFAARGLGSSGAALKGAANFATGLSDQTFNTRFGQELQSRQNTYNMLMGVAGLGENAAAQTGNYGMNMANQVGANTVGAGNASAAATMAAANGISSGLNNTMSNYLLYKGGFYG